MDGKYLYYWQGEGIVGVISDFEDIYITRKEFEAKECPIRNKERWLERKRRMEKALKSKKYQVNILLASYGQDNYCGDAFVLFERDGELFEVNGSHCSCGGLEGQWEPEKTSIEALRHRLDEGRLGVEDYAGNVFADELRQVLDEYEGGEMTQQIYMIQYRPADGFPWVFVTERTDSSVVYLSKEDAENAAHRMARINLKKYEFRIVLMRIAEVVEAGE